MLSESAQFQLFLKKEIEDRVEMIDDLGFEDPDMEEEEKSRISQINIVYNNEYIIHQLKKRGELLRDQKFKEVIQLQNQILARLKKDKHMKQNTELHKDHEQE